MTNKIPPPKADPPPAENSKSQKLRLFFRKNLARVLIGWLVLKVLFLSIFAVGTAFAADEKKIRVYLSEPIGAGTEVYHVTQCERKLKDLPLRCNAATADNYANICKIQKNGKEEIATGKYIEKCEDPSGAPPDGNCKKRLFVKEPVWAIVGCNQIGNNDCTQIDKFGVLEYVVQNSAPTINSRNPYDTSDNPKTYEEKYQGHTLRVKRVLQISSCVEGDFKVTENGGFGDLVGGSGTIGVGGTTSPDKPAECELKNQELLIDAGNSRDNLPPAISCNRVEMIESTTGTGLISEFVAAIYRWAAGIVGIVAVLVMVISGIQISAAAGDSAKVDEAKNRIMGSLAGLAILFLSGLILYTINPNFFTI